MTRRAGTRRQITRTTGNESNPRWARNDTAVTYVRDGNLFVVSLDAASPALVAQLTDVGPKKPEPRLTDSQKFIRDEEEKLIGFLKEQKEDKKRTKRRTRSDKLPALELQDRQSAVDLHARARQHPRLRDRRRASGRREEHHRAELRHRQSGYTEDIQGRTNVGDTQDRRLLAILNLETGKTAWADATFAPPVVEEDEAGAPAKPADAEDASAQARPAAAAPPRRSRAAHAEEGGARHPVVDAVAVGRWQLAMASARSADNKDRWLVTIDPETGKTKVVDLLHDDAWVREAGGAGRRVSAVHAAHPPRLVPLGARRLDAPLHAGCRRRRRQAAQLTSRQVGDRRRGAVARRARSSTSRAPRSILASVRSTRCRSTAARAPASRR